MVSWGSQEESGEAEAACWPVGSLLLVTPAKTYRRLGYSAPRKLDWTRCFACFSLPFLHPLPPLRLPPCLWVRQLLVAWSTHIHPAATVLLPSGLLHTLFPPGRLLVCVPDQLLLFFQNVSMYLAALGLSCGTRDLPCGVWVALVACMGSRGLSSWGTWA